MLAPLQPVHKVVAAMAMAVPAVRALMLVLVLVLVPGNGNDILNPMGSNWSFLNCMHVPRF
jgi:hypothetical protein